MYLDLEWNYCFSLVDFVKYMDWCINQLQAREHPPATPRVFVPSKLPGGRTYYQSTKLSVDAAWRHFSATNWSTIYCYSLVTKSVSKLGENFKTLSMVLELKLEGMTKE